MERGEFAYPLNGADMSLVPKGRARDHWVRLSPKLQGYFYGSFQKDGAFYEPKKRLPRPNGWRLSTNSTNIYKFIITKKQQWVIQIQNTPKS